MQSDKTKTTEPLFPDLTADHDLYWASLIASLISVLIHSYDHVTFYTCQFGACLGQDLQI